MAVQTTYPTRPDALLEGQIVDGTPATIKTRLAEAAMGFGKVAVQGTADAEAKPPEAGSLVFEGITVRVNSGGPTPADGYGIGDSMSVLDSGAIAVKAGEAVAAGDQAYFTEAGAIVKTATSNTIIPNGRFETSGALNAIVVLRIS